MNLFRREKETEWVEPTADVVVYCTSWCPSCARAKRWLTEHKINYVAVDIEENRAAAAQVRKWAHGNETTPTFHIGDEVVVDCDLNKVAELLGVT